MQKEMILSVGVDVGTSTARFVFSRKTGKNQTGNGTVPKISITDKEVIYRSNICTAPLISSVEMNTEQIMFWDTY